MLMVSGVKKSIIKFIIKKYDIGISNDNFDWVIAYADLRRDKNFGFLIKFVFRFLLFFVSIPFCNWKWLQIDLKKRNSKSVVLNRGNNREQQYYRNLLEDTSEIKNIDKKVSMRKNNFLFLLLFSLVCDFYNLEKCKQLIMLIEFLKNSKNYKFFKQTKFFCHDGSQPAQRLIALYVGKLGGQTARIITQRDFEVKTEFASTIMVNFEDQRFVNSHKVTLKLPELKTTINRLIIGAPSSFRPFGVEFRVIKLIIYHKWRKREFRVKLHPQCNKIQEVLLSMLIGQSFIIPRYKCIDGSKVKILIATYSSSLENRLNLSVVHKL